MRVYTAGEDCPRAAEVSRILGTLLRRHRLGGQGPVRENVLAEDEGEAYLVVAGTARREFRDPERHCDERARMAAVFAAMALESPAAAVPAAPPPVPPTRIITPITAARTHLEIEAAAVMEVLPSGGQASLSGGGSLHVVLLSRGLGAKESWSIGGSLGGGARSPSTTVLSGRAIDIVRLPFDASLRGSFRTGPAEVAMEAGALVAEAWTSWQSASLHYVGQGVGFGVRAAAQLRVWLAPRLAALVGMEVDELIRPSIVFECETGSCAGGEVHLGQLPPLQLAAFAGVALRAW